MSDIYMQDEDYHRLIEFMMDSTLGQIMRDHRDLIMMELGEKAGIWPEYTRDTTESKRH